MTLQLHHMLIYIQEPPHICLLLANKQWGLTLPSNGYITYSLTLKSACFTALVVYQSEDATSSLKVAQYNLTRMRVQDSQAEDPPTYNIFNNAFWIVIGI